jgi:tRNA threonylcarbamoyladenosine biosynthesis protein TsaE
VVAQVSTVELPTEQDTLHFGRRIGGLLAPGDLVLLAGPLGAGKTVLAKGIAAGLGVLGRVSSPTFIIAREHRPAPGGRGIPLVHVDAYRLGGLSGGDGGLDELDDLDLDTSLVEAAVVIEWGEGAGERLSADHLLIRLTRQEDDARLAEVVPHGSWVDRLTVLVR